MHKEHQLTDFEKFLKANGLIGKDGQITHRFLSIVSGTIAPKIYNDIFDVFGDNDSAMFAFEMLALLAEKRSVSGIHVFFEILSSFTGADIPEVVNNFWNNNRNLVLL
jgi:hypothetical protein